MTASLFCICTFVFRIYTFVFRIFNFKNNFTFYVFILYQTKKSIVQSVMSKKQKINKPRVVVTCKMGTIRMKSKKDYNRKKDKINLKKGVR
jgi:hypothetical protein